MDEDAFDAIYKNSADSIYYTALRYCGNHHVAQEITQTVFMKLLEDLGGVEEKASLVKQPGAALSAAPSPCSVTYGTNMAPCSAIKDASSSCLDFLINPKGCQLYFLSTQPKPCIYEL